MKTHIKKLSTNKEKKLKQKIGFTLIELLAIIALFGVVLTVAIFSGIDIIKTSKDKVYKEQVNRIIGLAKNWVIDNTDSLPNNKGETYQISLSQMKKSELLDDSVIDPRNNKEMNGCVQIILEQTYKYLYHDNCSTILNKFTVNTEEEWKNRDKEVKINYDKVILHVTYYLSNENKTPEMEAPEWQSSNLFYKDIGTYYAFVKDGNGNISAGKKVIVDKIDKIKPELKLKVTNQKNYFDIKLTATDLGGSGLSTTNKYQYYISTSNTTRTGGNWKPYTSGATIKVDYVDNNKRYIWIYPIKDNAENYNDENTNNTTPICIGLLDFSIFDTTKPTLTYQLVTSTATTATVKLTATDIGLGLATDNKYQYYLSTSNINQTGGNWTNYTSGSNFTLNGANGTYYLWVYSIKDKAGNVNGSYTNITPYVVGTYTFDGDKPTLTYQLISSTGKTSTVKLITADIGTGLATTNKYQYYLSTSNTSQTGGSWKTYTSGTNFTLTGTTGTYYLWVYSIKDKVGNINGDHKNITPYVIGTCIFDTTKPTLVYQLVSSTATTVTKRLTATDVGLGLATDNKYQYYLSTSNTIKSGGNWINYTSGANFTATAKAGTNYLWVYSIKDKAGNYNGNHVAKTDYVIGSFTAHTLTINANGGIWNGTNKQAIIQKKAITIENPKRINYLFDGWTVSGTGSSISGTTFTMGEANTTLTAKWVSCFSPGNYTYTGKSQNINDGNGKYRIKFLTSGTFKTKCPATIDVFLVGGGSSLGGSGYTKTYKTINLTANTSYPIVVGPGGVAGKNGSKSTAFGKTANPGNGCNGGSGCGSSGYTNPGQAGGNNGTNGANGGKGQGTTTKEFGEAAGTLYAGGGGGGGGAVYGTNAKTFNGGAGGAGGGGKGAGPNNNCSNGKANTGSGAGLGIRGTAKCLGGSGIVVIRNIIFSGSDKYEYTGNSQYIDDGNENYRIKFLSSGTLKMKANATIDVFLVGGGSSWGGSGYTATYKSIKLTANTSYQIVVGDGGIPNYNGSASTAFGKTANPGNGKNGGSGAGASGYTWDGGAGGSNGSNGITSVTATGGKGQGTTTKEFGEATGTLYAGGGGGGGGAVYGTNAKNFKGGPGGAGGGGTGGCSNASTSAKANTGSGAGLGCRGDTAPNYGGSGIVIIRNAR